MLAACASLYREVIKVGLSPAEADRQELWQLAALLTGGNEEGESGDGSAYSGPRTPSTPNSDDLLRARVLAARAGETQPELPGMSEGQVIGVMGEVNRATR